MFMVVSVLAGSMMVMIISVLVVDAGGFVLLCVFSYGVIVGSLGVYVFCWGLGSSLVVYLRGHKCVTRTRSSFEFERKRCLKVCVSH
jgi:hypothetical protein